MNKESIILAKVAALKKNFKTIPHAYNSRCEGRLVRPLLPLYSQLIIDLKLGFNGLYNDLPVLSIPVSIGDDKFDGNSIDPLINNLDYVLEVYSNIRIGENKEDRIKPDRIFISHGRSDEWRKLQAYLDKDLEYKTLELAQEANLGRTILQKLSEEAQKCSVAIIVMSGDDKFTSEETRVRENVMHEIGFFQGLYGLSKVILLYEAEVNIPSNIHGLVYIPYPKDTIDATFGAIHRELKVLMA